MEGSTTKATYIAVNSASQRVNQGGGAWGYSPFKWDTGGKSAVVLVKPLWTLRASECLCPNSEFVSHVWWFGR